MVDIGNTVLGSACRIRAPQRMISEMSRFTRHFRGLRHPDPGRVGLPGAGNPAALRANLISRAAATYP